MGTRKRRSVCEPEMTFQDCELAILRHAVDKGEKIKSKRVAHSEDMGKIISILETFLRSRKLICYGGTAINNILPQEAQFYDRNIEIPDYDFFSTNAMDDAKDLADIYLKEGYYEVEAKAGVHFGTYKVFVNFVAIADITQLHPTLYKSIEKEAIEIEGIHYAPPNYLRMSMFLELSRPEGDLSRWEKVLKRMNILNEHYPLKQTDCDKIDFQRQLDTPSLKENAEKYYYIIRDAFIEQNAVFLGGYGTTLYSKYMPKSRQHQIQKIPDFDVLAEDPEHVCDIVKNKLSEQGIKGITIKKHDAVGEVVPEHLEIRIQKETVALVFKPIACHAYNKLFIDGKHICVASIDTMLSFYLAFIYADKPYFPTDRILCMAMYLFEVEQKNRLSQRGLLKRFTLTCFGKQPTLDDIRQEKAKVYESYKGKKKDRNYELWFLRYVPKSQVKTDETERDAKKEKRKLDRQKKSKKNKGKGVSSVVVAKTGTETSDGEDSDAGDNGDDKNENVAKTPSVAAKVNARQASLQPEQATGTTKKKKKATKKTRKNKGGILGNVMNMSIPKLL